MNIPDQQLRIFLSSTFSDMQEERDALVKLFREMAVEGQRRGIDIKLVDLRWGVTDDQRRTGRVISTCLQEIDNSRPFFIGLIGDRYGWIPSMEELAINPELRKKMPIVEEYCKQGLSITEIEMRYGSLDATSNRDSLFLIKGDFKPENERHHELYQKLISGKVNHLFYYSIEELTTQTRAEMIQLLDRNFPILSDVPEWKQYQKKHDNISKTLRDGYIPYSNYISSLNQWLKSDSQYLVVSGEPGSGKSALIAHWLSANDFGEYKVIYHFIGNGLAEGAFTEIQRHFLTRLENEYGLEPTPVKETSEYEDYIIELEGALKAAALHGDRWLLVVDGLNHIQNDAMTKMMMWFPELPPSHKALFSTIKGDVTYQRLCEACGYEEICLLPLNEDLTLEILNRYLANVGKTLDSALAKMIATNPLFYNPSVLRLLLDELLTYGVYETIGSDVSYYAESKDKIGFYTKIIAHAQDYYGNQVIKDVLCLVVCTKDGLSDSAIIEILNLDQLDWAMIYAGLQRILVFYNGKYRIINTDFQTTIIYYFKLEDDDCLNMVKYETRILTHLEKDNTDIEEMAYLYFCTDNIEKLHALLINPVNVELCLHSDRLFAMYWNAIMEQTDYSLDEYLDLEFQNLPDWDVDEQLEFLALAIETQFSDFELSIKLKEKQIAYLLSDNKKNGTDNSYVGSIYDSIAQTYIDLGNWEKARDCLNKAFSIYTSSSDGIWSNHFFILGNLNCATGNREEALDFFLKAIEMEEEADEEVPWKYFNNAGLTLFYLGRLEEAHDMLYEALEKIKKNMIVQTLEGAMVMNNLGLVFNQMERYDEAEAYFNKALQIYELNLETPGYQVAMAYNNLGVIYRDRQDPDHDRALESFMKAYEILNDISETSPQHGLICQNIGIEWRIREDFNQAAQWLKKSLDAYRNSSDIGHPEFLASFSQLMEVYMETDRYEEVFETAQTFLIMADEEYGPINRISAFCHLYLGDVYLLADSSDESRCEYLSARDIFVQTDDSEGLEYADSALSQFNE